MRLLPLGDRAIIVEVADLDAVHRLAADVQTASPPGIVDVVPGARTVTLHVATAEDLDVVRRRLAGLPRTEPATATAAPVRIDVHYDGPDLAAAAAALDISIDTLVERHTDEAWRVAFGGFAPGFAYLSPTTHEWSVPRLPAPRPSVPAGSVALADTWSGIYPQASPGGWLLIGRTDARLFDVDRDPPALLRPGGAVCFRSLP